MLVEIDRLLIYRIVFLADLSVIFRVILLLLSMNLLLIICLYVVTLFHTA